MIIHLLLNQILSNYIPNTRYFKLNLILLSIIVTNK